MFVIADAHIHTNAQYKDFIEVLKVLNDYDDVVLLGDIIDLTKTTPSKLFFREAHFGEAIYVKGNHDIIIDRLISAEDRYKCSETKLVFEHGHRFEALLDSNLFLGPEHYEMLFERLCYSRTGSKIGHMIWKIRTMMMFGKRDRTKLAYQMLELMAKSGNYVCGHCHRQLISEEDRCVILDAYSDRNCVYWIGRQGKEVLVYRADGIRRGTDAKNSIYNEFKDIFGKS